MRSRWRPPAALLAAALALAACRKSGDPVRESLDRMVRAADERDASALFENVSEGFEAADGSSRAEAEAMVRRYFAAYEIIDVSIKGLEIERGEEATRARFRAELSGQPRRVGGLEGLFPSSAAYDFDLRLVPEDGRWRVAWASWQEGAR